MDLEETVTIREAIDAMAQAQPEGEFLISPETGAIVSFQELRKQSILLCNMLRQAGLETGDKVAFMMDNGLLSGQLFLGAMYGGYVTVPLNLRAGVVQLSYMLDHCDAKVVFVEERYADLLSEALKSVRRDMRVIAGSVDGPLPAFETAADGSAPLHPAAGDVALLMYSSGSTGKPKAAIHTHSSLLGHGRNSIEAHQLSSTDRSLLVLPLYHINAECVTLIPTLLSGGSVAIAHRFDVSRFWDWIDALHITWSALVPTILSELVEWDDPGKDQRQAAFGRIRFLRSSSAPLSPSLHRRFVEKFNLPLLQAMGSTEGGNVFSNPVPPGKNKIGSPGLPWGFEARIIDRQGTDVPSGEAGEVLIRGDGLMKGYYKDPEGTAAVMDSDGWLHTGDLARRDEDGYFFIVGRSKELIIKGGVNIAPRQIDEVLESHPAVLEAAAVGAPDRYFGEDAVAFVVLRPGATADEKELLAFCETRLGHFKTPSRVHFLKELPKGPSGKVQRLRLLDPAILSAVVATTQLETKTVTINGNGHRSDSNLASMGSSIEQIIAAAWEEVLAVPHVDPDTNFFALGGHSLLAIQCLSKLRNKLPIVLTLADFFESSTVTKQVELVRQRLRLAEGTGGKQVAEQSTNWEQTLLQQYVPAAAERVIPHLDSSHPRPLSTGQQRLWFMEQMNRTVPVYNEAEAVRLTGDLNVDALESAMNMIVDRHPVLRSTIKVIDGVPYGVIHESWPLRLKRIDLCSLSPAEREAEVNRLLIDEPRALYNLEAEPGIRVALLRLSSREHVLILMMHHLVCDWASEGVIWRELSALYHSFISGELVALPDLPITYTDVVAWQQQMQATTSYAEDMAFWDETLRGAPALLELPADRTRPPIMSYRGHRLRWKLSGALTEALRNTSRQEKTSLFTIFAAALDTLLYRYTGSDDLMIGLPLADRDRQELQSVVGFLLHTHVLRTRLSGDMTFRDLLSRVQKAVLDLYTHRSIPFDQIVQKLRPERNLSYTPLFQVMLNWRDRDQQLSFIGMDGLAIDSLMAAANTSKFDLLLIATDTGNEIWLELEYNTDLFDENRIERMLVHYQTLLEAVAVDPGASLADMPLLTSSEHQQVVFDWNKTESGFSTDFCIQELFEEQVREKQQAIAVMSKKDSLSYQELNQRANQLAHYLRKLGVGPDKRVALCLERGFEMIVAMLAVLKAGGAYVPLDPAYPAERLRFMLEDSAPVALLTQIHLHKVFSGLSNIPLVLDLEAGSPPWIEELDSNLDPASIGLTAKHMAYVIYTSGSTGKPKGVGIEHRNTVNLISWGRKSFAGDILKCTLFSTSLNFDLAVFECFVPLSTGAMIRIVPNVLDLLDAPADVTLINTVPSAMNSLIEANGVPQTVRTVNLAGEPLKRGLVERIFATTGVNTVCNLYGPSETTTYSTRVMMKRSEGFAPHIGRPIANTQTYILDSLGKPVPIGVVGELYIGGAGVARGYLNRPELTAERFLNNPFVADPDARMYRTGDLCRWLPDGNIEFLGRNDFQVKIRGFRIELGEIEALLEQQEGVRQCVVTVEGDDSADKRLVAHIIPSDLHAVPKVEVLWKALKRKLPSYMIPAAFSFNESMQLTPNGKIDRKALSQSDLTTIHNEVSFEAPRDSVEAKLVQIWEQFLEVRPIGIRTNFFDSGGSSLMALKLFSRIRKTFRCSLPVTIIFGSPTIEQLATQIQGAILDAALVQKKRTEMGSKTRSSVVPIQPHGSAAPIFIIHGAAGNIIRFYKLAMLTGTDHPFYGVEAQSLLDGQPALLRLKDQAAYYLSEIRKIQPRGPYYLLGFSMGGTIAFELAHQLHALGERVELLGMLDTRRCDYMVEMERNDPVRTRVERRVARFRRNFAPLRAWEKATYIPQRLLTRALCITYSVATSLGFRSVPSFMKSVYYISTVAERNYRLRPWPGRVTLFRASGHWDPRLSLDLGWRTLAKGGIEVFEVPGTHDDLVFNEQNIRALAEQLRAWLEKSDIAMAELKRPAYSA
jgi:amino acid adenylation domain-containing protein